MLSMGMINRILFSIKVKPGIISMLILACVVTMRISSVHAASYSYLLLMGYALIGRSQAILALVMSWFITLINPGILPEFTLGSIGRFGVIYAAAVSVLLRYKKTKKSLSINKFIIVTFILGMFFVFHSIMFSKIPDVSILKALTWTISMVTLISAWVGLLPVQRTFVFKQLITGLTLLMLVSLPLIALPIGYFRNHFGFQGVLNHPQVYGATIALLAAWPLSRIIGEKKPPWSAVILILLCISMILLSETRTAGVALIAGVTIAIFFAPLLSGKSIRVVLPGLRSRRIHILFIIIAVVSVLTGPVLAERIDQFITKRGRAAGLIEAYNLSRGQMIADMQENIKRQPFRGIGFGIASNPQEMVIERDPVMSLPIGAPTEKGVLPLAVLEETGILGLTLVAAWIFMLLRYSARGGVVSLAVTTTALFLNLGEATLFSPGGFGILPLVFIGWASTSDKMQVG